LLLDERDHDVDTMALAQLAERAYGAGDSRMLTLCSWFNWSTEMTPQRANGAARQERA
jgi:hypothetical protein